MYLIKFEEFESILWWSRFLVKLQAAWSTDCNTRANFECITTLQVPGSLTEFVYHNNKDSGEYQ